MGFFFLVFFIPFLFLEFVWVTLCLFNVFLRGEDCWDPPNTSLTLCFTASDIFRPLTASLASPIEAFTPLLARLVKNCFPASSIIGAALRMAKPRQIIND